jgi:hypothetical protein
VTSPSQYQLEYDWRRDGVPITGYTSSSQYVLTPEDLGTAITVRVRAVKTFYYWGTSSFSAAVDVP